MIRISLRTVRLQLNYTGLAIRFMVSHEYLGRPIVVSPNASYLAVHHLGIESFIRQKMGVHQRIMSAHQTGCYRFKPWPWGVNVRLSHDFFHPPRLSHGCHQLRVQLKQRDTDMTCAAGTASSVARSCGEPSTNAVISMVSTLLGARYKAKRDTGQEKSAEHAQARQKKDQIERLLRKTYVDLAAPILKSLAKLAERLHVLVDSEWDQVERKDAQ